VDTKIEMPEDTGEDSDLRLASSLAGSRGSQSGSKDGSELHHPELADKNNLQSGRTGLKSDAETFKMVNDPVNKGQMMGDEIELNRLAVNGKRGEVRMELNPPSLGRLQVEFALADDKLRAVFHTDSLSAKGLIEENIQSLRDSLGKQSLNLDSFDVFSENEGGKSWNEGTYEAEKMSRSIKEGLPEAEEVPAVMGGDRGLSQEGEGLDVFA